LVVLHFAFQCAAALLGRYELCLRGVCLRPELFDLGLQLCSALAQVPRRCARPFQLVRLRLPLLREPRFQRDSLVGRAP